MMSTIDSLLSQLRTAIAAGEAAARNEALDALRSLQLSLETPQDTLFRLTNTHLEIAMTRIGQDLGVYESLVEAGAQGLGVKGLAEKTGGAPVLLARILRYLASVGQISQLSSEIFGANDMTRMLAAPGYRGAVYHQFNNIGPVLQALPDFLKETKYADVDDAAKTAAQKAYDTDLPMFQYLPRFPERFGPLQQAMSVLPQGQTQWFKIFDFEKELSLSGGANDSAPALVDVGGGFGQQCLALLKAFPQLDGKLVLQDLPQTLGHLPPGALPAGLKTMAHNFFEAQPETTRNARFYYLRAIMHDWPDDKCVEILGHLKDAFGPGSKILIDEAVLPDIGAHWYATSADMTMMSSLGARERTKTEWEALISKAGLKILGLTTYFPRLESSIIVVGI